MFAAALAFAATSSVTGAYIYSYHAEHFKNTLFEKGVELYSNARLKYREYVPLKDDSEKPNITITNIKLMRNGDTIELDSDTYSVLTWEKLGQNSQLHVVYQFQDKEYRITLSPGDNLRILVDDFEWLQEGFLNGVENIESNLDVEFRNLIDQYAGPLGDFYQEAEIKQNAKGFLNHDLSEGLLSDGKYIKVTNILGETITFDTK